MALTNPEVQSERETPEQKQKRLDGFDELSDSGKRAFDDILNQLRKPKNGGEKYETSDIKDAASKHLDKMVDDSGVQVSKLNPDEKQKLENLKSELLHNMDGKSPKDAVEEFGKIQEKIVGIIAAGDGKSQKDYKNFQQSQEKRKETNQETQDAFDKFQDFLDEVRERQKKANEDAKKQQDFAKTAGDKQANQDRQYAGDLLKSLSTLA